MSMLVEDMRFANKDVCARIRNSLRGNNIKTLGELLEHTEDDLLDIRNFGTVCLAEVTVKLKSMGLALKKRQRW